MPGDIGSHIGGAVKGTGEGVSNLAGGTSEKVDKGKAEKMKGKAEEKEADAEQTKADAEQTKADTEQTKSDAQQTQAAAEFAKSTAKAVAEPVAAAGGAIGETLTGAGGLYNNIKQGQAAQKGAETEEQRMQQEEARKNAINKEDVKGKSLENRKVLLDQAQSEKETAVEQLNNVLKERKRRIESSSIAAELAEREKEIEVEMASFYLEAEQRLEHGNGIIYVAFVAHGGIAKLALHKYLICNPLQKPFRHLPHHIFDNISHALVNFGLFAAWVMKQENAAALGGESNVEGGMSNTDGGESNAEIVTEFGRHNPLIMTAPISSILHDAGRFTAASTLDQLRFAIHSVNEPGRTLEFTIERSLIDWMHDKLGPEGGHFMIHAWQPRRYRQIALLHGPPLNDKLYSRGRSSFVGVAIKMEGGRPEHPHIEYVDTSATFSYPADIDDYETPEQIAEKQENLKAGNAAQNLQVAEKRQDEGAAALNGGALTSFRV